MRAALRAAVHHHIDAVADGVEDVGQLLDGAARTLELAAAVVGQHDAGAADVDVAVQLRRAERDGKSVALVAFAVAAGDAVDCQHHDLHVRRLGARHHVAVQAAVNAPSRPGVMGAIAAGGRRVAHNSFAIRVEPAVARKS